MSLYSTNFDSATPSSIEEWNDDRLTTLENKVEELERELAELKSREKVRDSHVRRIFTQLFG